MLKKIRRLALSAIVFSSLPAGAALMEVESYSFAPGVLPSGANQFISIENGVGGRYARFFMDLRGGQFSIFPSGPGGVMYSGFEQYGGTLATNPLLAADGGRLRFNNPANGLAPGVNYAVFQPDTSSPANGGDEIAIVFDWSDTNGDGLVDNGGDVVEFLGAVYSPTQDAMIFDTTMIGDLLGVAPPPVPEPSRTVLLAGALAGCLCRRRRL